MAERRAKAIEIFKERFPELKGRKFTIDMRDTGYIVYILEDGIVYCSINTKTGVVKGI